MGKTKINESFKRVKDRNEKAFVPYIMAGDGGLEVTQERIEFLERCGVTAIELGIPFSDPVADGPTIQAAGIRALQQGTTLAAVLNHLQAHPREVPLILMTYFNSIFSYGIEKFVQDCDEAGVDGLIIPDLPIEEEHLITGELGKKDIALIRLAAITSPEDRIKEIALRTEGFLYAVTVTGTTGSRTSFHDNVETYLSHLSQSCSVPVLAGFGVSTPDHVRHLTNYCDGVVVGSKMIELFQQRQFAEIEQLVQSAKDIHTLN
ncbi:tryptophan synthase subunit alpha [Bacillus ginsengihumi]|uniref:Tryptophan synthase alpha chain n=1 Tax=Heyndrickxia ginsengihumi TaxID=363870 RepID=A0A6M0P629_9BACI|nr:tryptophan synthase subunit alpha [Heyndrickxia ginsengihumi]MBE6183534.1 tryptophan synthase subunit alpha [Bacillus sp. (in: firmicutes)]MCM3024510.1 tryptophan synthase subunit alpha [Heyndrickxia ginsengihumi]NEY20182.1 tryptophan synthase subunit alpha [Heyndrickxia ginsengihumi]